MIVVRGAVASLHALRDILIPFLDQTFLPNVVTGLLQVISVLAVFFKVLRRALGQLFKDRIKQLVGASPLPVGSGFLCPFKAPQENPAPTTRIGVLDDILFVSNLISCSTSFTFFNSNPLSILPVR